MQPTSARGIVTILCIASLSGVAQKSTATPEPGSISGRIIDAATGRPLAGVGISYTRGTIGTDGIWFMGKEGAGASTHADANGEFQFIGVAPGDYALFTNATGYSLANAHARLAPGEELKGVVVRLTPYASLSGQITDRDKKPLARMEVQLWQISYLSGERRWLSAGVSQFTDAEGRYRLTDVIPGRYYLGVTPRDESASKVSGAERFVRSFYPGTVYSEIAVPIDLVPGIETPNINVKLAKSATVHVSGVVRGGKSADVYLTPDGVLLNSRKTTKSDDDGKFEFTGILPGSYRLRARLKESDGKEGNKEEWASRPLNVGSEGAENINLSLTPTPAITGRIHIDGSEDGVDFSKFAIELLQVEPGEISGSEPVKKDGTFELLNLPPGKYALNCISFLPGFYLQRVRAGTLELEDRLLDLDANFAAQLSLDLTVSPKAASVSGTLFLGDPGKIVGEGVVVLVPQNPMRKENPNAYLRAYVDSKGRFTIPNVPPGEYRAYAWRSLDTLTRPFMDMNFMAPFESRGVNVKLDEGDHAEIKIPVITEQ